ncbi:MAG: hypothetical protein AB1671_25590 [Thermodesulfobacteriota bacterium]
MANQNRGERLRQFLQWRRQQAGGGRFGRFQGGMGPGQFGGGGRFGRFQGGMDLGAGQGTEDIHSMDAEQRAQYRQRLEFRINWLEKRLAQAVGALEELDAFEAAEAGGEAPAPAADPFAAAENSAIESEKSG